MAQTHDLTTQHLCPACSFGPFTRNNYFTGKLLVERDFTDETRFHIEKLRHHEQQLHGWGVVCGLKVKPHPTETCRDRFVCIEPGSAVDCCGHDIIVREEECIDITQFEAIKALDKIQGEERRKPHTLKICVRFRECPTEEIPVLYDDCGCDDTKCAPNRILESYDVDVIVDPPPLPDSSRLPELAWNNSVTLLADVSRVALHDASHRLYLLVGDDVYQVDTTTPIVGPNFHLIAKGLEIAISNSGDHLFVVTEPPLGSATSLRQLVVVKTSDMSQVRVLDVPDSVGSNIRPVVASDHRLMMLVAPPGVVQSHVLIWDADLTGPTAPVTPAKVVLTPNLQSLAVASDAAHAYAVGPSANAIKVVNTTGTPSAGADIPILPAAAKPTAIAVVRSTASDLLAITDTDGKKLYVVRPDLVNPSASQLFPAVSLDHPPVELAISNGGHWGYVLERETAAPEKSFVQAVDLFQLSQNQAVPAKASLQVGDASQRIIAAASGALLYIPYLGATANPFDGGVAKIDIKNLACDDLLWEHLNGCPHCDSPNCVVLATITDYRIDGPINDANIDNRKGRRLLPSTQVLTEVIECLLEHGTGGGGMQGPPGAPGKNGEKGEDGAAGVGERGPEGPIGPGLEKGLTQIVALSWVHNEQSRLVPIVDVAGAPIGKGIVLGFNRSVSIPNETEETAADHVFQVLVQHDLLFEDEPQLRRKGVICRCPVQGKVLKVKPDTLSGLITSAQQTNGPDSGLAFIFSSEIEQSIKQALEGNDEIELWVRLRGDFVIDTQGRAVDAEFVRAELPSGDRPKGNEFGIQGGLFESWFQI